MSHIHIPLGNVKMKPYLLTCTKSLCNYILTLYEGIVFIPKHIKRVHLYWSGAGFEYILGPLHFEHFWRFTLPSDSCWKFDQNSWSAVWQWAAHGHLVKRMYGQRKGLSKDNVKHQRGSNTAYTYICLHIYFLGVEKIRLAVGAAI